MKLDFLGTRGYIKARTERHYRHSSCLVTWRDTRVLLDLGEDWLEAAPRLKPDAILVTHAHPDHAWGLKNGAAAPVWATAESWEPMNSFRVDERRIVVPRSPDTVGDITFEAFTVEHSTRAPAVGYRLTAGGVSVFYVPDLVYIHERADALRGTRAYIGDAATVNRSFVRKRGEALIGHAPVQTQLTWCRKEGVPLAVFTHCGSQVVAYDERAVISTIEAMARDRGVEVIVAYDGMELEVGATR